MSMSEDDSANVSAIFDEIRNVGNDNVDAQQFGFGEHQAGVDDDDVVTPANGHTVHPELAKTAERYDMQLSSGHGELLMLARKSCEYRVPSCERSALGARAEAKSLKPRS
jgi:hypothetical protein